MLNHYAVHINFTGGIISPGHLKEVLEAAAAARVAQVRFGLRQQMIMDVPIKYFPAFEKTCTDKKIYFYKAHNALPNIASSYVCAGIFANESWLREGVYKDVFDLFDYVPQLKINICDSHQNLLPFFSGHLNWISSGAAHFWYLYIRFPETRFVFCWPLLIYTNDIPLLSKHIEKIMLNAEKKYFNNKPPDGNGLYQTVQSAISYMSKSIEEELALPAFSLPYYEGFNKADNNFWLGIYRRNELFPVSFLLDACAVCLETKVAQLYTTPWKSIIIKDIDFTHRNLWSFILGKHQISVRHAANELNWQVEDHNEEGLSLKRNIIRHFDKADVRTYGLCFAIQTNPTTNIFGSVIIRRRQNKNPHRLKSLERFDILYTRDFNPNSGELIMFRDNVAKDHIGTYLVSLCKFFYEKESNSNILQHYATSQSSADIEAPVPEKIYYQCSHCLTVYDDQYGDPENNIAAGIAFNDLPVTYRCPLCENEKKDFVAVEESKLRWQAV